jgi:hypothetical protein
MLNLTAGHCYAVGGRFTGLPKEKSKVESDPLVDEARLRAAEDKRARKAAKRVAACRRMP